ncbi:hypothetical protein [Niveibacterium sp.]|uniref:hypothetical protein n=1 Tax=Niveibacterium sp. TaxID=2017444 RepID=UPI0035AD8C07
MAVIDYADSALGDALSFSATTEAVEGHVARVRRGDLGGAEAMLVAQAIALDGIFAAMAHRAAGHVGQRIDLAERYLRLGLKAQAQSRATLQTLIEAKSPPVVFARQANVTSGPQQNHIYGTAAGTPAHARAEMSGAQSNELLGATHGERMDPGTASPAGGGDSALDALDSIDGAKDCDRKTDLQQEREDARPVQQSREAGAEEAGRSAAPTAHGGLDVAPCDPEKSADGGGSIRRAPRRASAADRKPQKPHIAPLKGAGGTAHV